MDAVNTPTIEARVEKLERAARRWRLAFAALCVCVVGMGAGAGAVLTDAEFKTVKATKFQVVDGKGVVVAELGLSPGGDSTGLMVTESAKKKAILLTPGNEPRIFNNE